MIHKPNCENNEITNIRTSSESHLHWKDEFYKNLLYFRNIENFEAEIDFHISNIDKKQLMFLNNPVCNSYYIVSELNGALQNTSYEFLLHYDNVDWFIKEIRKKSENEMTFYFEITNKSFVMTEEHGENCKIDYICRFCEKMLNLIKLRITAFC